MFHSLLEELTVMNLSDHYKARRNNIGRWDLYGPDYLLNFRIMKFRGNSVLNEI